jgi:hypothetical protein
MLNSKLRSLPPVKLTGLISLGSVDITITLLNRSFMMESTETIKNSNVLTFEAFLDCICLEAPIWDVENVPIESS